MTRHPQWVGARLSPNALPAAGRRTNHSELFYCSPLVFFVSALSTLKLTGSIATR